MAVLEVDPAPSEELRTVLSADATSFLSDLHARFGSRRNDLLAARAERHAEWRAGKTLDFLPETAGIRKEVWTVAGPRSDYADRRVEITGPTDAKMMINALNSGARGFMADCEDAVAPTWENVVEGQRNLLAAVEGSLAFESPDGRQYSLGKELATLLVRPRGLHLPERHIRHDGQPLAGALVDFGLYAFHCAARQLDRGSAPYLYLPKLEHHLEARLWNEILAWSEEALGIPAGSFRATVLIETLPAAFQMHEILWELRERSYGLNAGRWDYIFSAIKCMREDAGRVLPNRQDVSMTVPFLRAYTELLVQTCHSRGAFAMGGMAALIPSRKDAEVSERAFAAVRADKRREAGDGFDGTWVAHPDVVGVASAEFDAVLGDRPNQISRLRPEVEVTATQLLDLASTPGEITIDGLRNDVSVAFQYISSWLCGRGAVGINNMMEDAATAEICRAQIWQWIRHGAELDDGRTVTEALVREVLDEEIQKIRDAVGSERFEAGRPTETRTVFERTSLTGEFPEFVTLAAYEVLESN